MPRKTFLMRHTRFVPPDESAARKYLMHWETGELYHNPEAFPRLTSEALFGNNLPLELEVGCGTGEYLCSLATAEPGVNFVGIDISLKSLYEAVRGVQSLGLENIRFLKAPVQYLYPLMPTASLQAVYLHFPEPGLRPKFRKRNLHNGPFFSEVARALMPGGRLSIVTDSEQLFSDLLTRLEDDINFSRHQDEPYLIGFAPPTKSRYQLYWEQLEAPIYRLEVKRDA